MREEERESSSPAAPRLPGSLPELQAAVLGPRAASWAPGKAAQDAEKSCPRPRRLGLWDAAAGSCAGPGLQPACSHARLGFLRVGAGAGALRGCRIPWHWACGGPTTERARTRTTHTHKRVRARTHTVCTRTPPSHTHTHTRPCGGRLQAGQYWFRNRGRAASRSRARAGASSLTKHTCLGTADKASVGKCLAAAPQRPGLRRRRDTVPRPIQEGTWREHRSSRPGSGSGCGGQVPLRASPSRSLMARRVERGKRDAQGRRLPWWPV